MCWFRCDGLDVLVFPSVRYRRQPFVDTAYAATVDTFGVSVFMQRHVVLPLVLLSRFDAVMTPILSLCSMWGPDFKLIFDVGFELLVCQALSSATSVWLLNEQWQNIVSQLTETPLCHLPTTGDDTIWQRIDGYHKALHELPAVAGRHDLVPLLREDLEEWLGRVPLLK